MTDQEPNRDRQPPSEQRGGSTPDEGEAREKGKWAEPPSEMLDDDPELQSSVLGETTGSDSSATEQGLHRTAGDAADATSDGGSEPPEDAEPDTKDVAAAQRERRAEES